MFEVYAKQRRIIRSHCFILCATSVSFTPNKPNKVHKRLPEHNDLWPVRYMADFLCLPLGCSVVRLIWDVIICFFLSDYLFILLKAIPYYQVPNNFRSLQYCQEHKAGDVGTL